MRKHPNRSRVLTGSKSEAIAFDKWLTCQLRSMYADIASEPLPAELADLLEDHEVQRDAAKDYTPQNGRASRLMQRPHG